MVRNAKRSLTACCRCGLAAGNSRGIGVYWHMLQRSVYDAGWEAKGYPSSRRTIRVGSIPLCDRCIDEAGHPNERLVEIRMLEGGRRD